MLIDMLSSTYRLKAKAGQRQTLSLSLGIRMEVQARRGRSLLRVLELLAQGMHKHFKQLLHLHIVCSVLLPPSET